MESAPRLEFSAAQRQTLREAKRLAWWTIAYLISAGIALYLVLGASQAMKAAWLETVFSIVTPIVFLIGVDVAQKPPNRRFPYGYHRSVSIAFLGASLALFALGAYILFDSTMKLIQQQHQTIGTVRVLGEDLWLGWLMLPALAWSAVPAYFIGHAQQPHARALNDKVLSADANMRKADWLTAGAAALGVLGIGSGWWWVDPVAAAAISISLLRDGYRRLRHAVTALTDAAPKTVSGKRDPLPEQVAQRLRALDWVADAEVRLREEGHLLFGEAFVVPKSDENLTRNIRDAIEDMRAMDWRLRSLSITPLPSLGADQQT